MARSLPPERSAVSRPAPSRWAFARLAPARPAPARPAFTLVELLVVIGIIGALIALLLPALGGARRQARIIRCSATLRSIGQACLLHAAGTKGYLPLAGQVTAPPAADPRNFPATLQDPDRRRYVYAIVPRGVTDVSVVPFTAALAPHFGVGLLPDQDWNALDQALNAREGVWKHFVCPDTDSLERANASSSPDDATVVGQGTMLACALGPSVVLAWATNSDYAANEGVFGYHYDGRYQHNRLGGRLAAVRRATEVVLFGDAVPRQTPAAGFIPQGWQVWTPSLDGTGPATLGDALAGTGRADAPENFDLRRHGKHLNAVFADGHVETLPVEKGALDRAYLVAP